MVFQNLYLSILLCCAATLGAPVPEALNVTESVTLLERSSATNPIDATFDITGWPNIAEENCFAMLCLRNGNRV